MNFIINKKSKFIFINIFLITIMYILNYQLHPIFSFSSSDNSEYNLQELEIKVNDLYVEFKNTVLDVED